VKNITVSVPNDVYRTARVRAAERGSSVSALVAEYLRSLSDQEKELARLAERRRRIIAQITHFSAADRLDRDAVHERGVR
jgi:plasmid stability protein